MQWLRGDNGDVVMDRLPSWPHIPTSDVGPRLIPRSWGRFLDGSSEMSLSGIMVTLGSIPCTTTSLLTTGSIHMIQGGELVRRRAALLGRKALAIQVSTVSSLGVVRCSFGKLGPYHWFAWYICRLTRYTSRLVGLS